VIELFASGSLLLLLDQWSKGMAQVHARGRGFSWGPVLRIRCLTNLRVARSRDGARVALVLVWVIALVSSVVLYRSGVWFQSHVALIGLGLAFGGAAGNLLDLLRLRGIIDFIDLRWWPVFNLADVAIICGLAVALWQRT
jgi:signal peptidase II